MTTDTATLNLANSLANVERPMLARVADAAYWMARYVERAEHVARVLNVTTNLLADIGDVAPELRSKQWSAVLRTFHLEPGDVSGEDVVRMLSFDNNEPGSILRCIKAARENARAIRENISAEMYEALNGLHWELARGGDRDFADSPEVFYDRIMNFGMLFQGLTDHTLFHDQRWQFTQLGKWFERIDVICRLLEGQFEPTGQETVLTAEALRNVHWMAVLRMTCGLEVYRRRHPADLSPGRIAAFLILEREFPRSIRFGVAEALAAVRGIRQVTGRYGTDEAADAERLLGRLDAQLEYARIDELFHAGLSEHLADVRTTIRNAAVAVSQAYFLR